MNGKLLFSGDFHVGTNWQIMFAILCKNPNIAIILIITRKCQLFTSGRIRKSPLHNIEHTMPPLPLQKPTSLQLQVSKSYRSIFSNLSFTFNHMGHMGKICQIWQMKFELLSGLLFKHHKPCNSWNVSQLQFHLNLQNSQVSKQRKQNYYAATVFTITHVKYCSCDVILLQNKWFGVQSGCSNCPDILHTARYILVLCHKRGKTHKHHLQNHNNWCFGRNHFLTLWDLRCCPLSGLLLAFLFGKHLFTHLTPSFIFYLSISVEIFFQDNFWEDMFLTSLSCDD